MRRPDANSEYPRQDLGSKLPCKKMRSAYCRVELRTTHQRRWRQLGLPGILRQNVAHRMRWRNLLPGILRLESRNPTNTTAVTQIGRLTS